METSDWGYRESFADAFRAYEQDGYIPGRVVRQVRGRSVGTVTSWGDMELVTPREAEAVVGDWAAVDPVAGRLVAVLPRSSEIARRRPGRAERQQTIAANVDVALIMTGLDEDYSVRRIERYLALAAAGGVDPVVVLTKVDLCPAPEDLAAEARSVAGSHPVLSINALRGEGVDDVRALVPRGQTAVLLGSSGVGKSTLLNALLGDERMSTRAVGSDGRGRHTTTHRELFPIPGGGLVADVPGLREVGLVGTDADVASVFLDVEQLAAECRFSDCRHDGEPDCAVTEAVREGRLDASRLESFHGLRREAAANERRADEHLRRRHDRQTYGRYRLELRRRRKAESRADD